MEHIQAKCLSASGVTVGDAKTHDYFSNKAELANGSVNANVVMSAFTTCTDPEDDRVIGIRFFLTSNTDAGLPEYTKLDPIG